MSEKCFISVYIGIPDDVFESRIYVDFITPHRQFNLYFSEALDNLDPVEFNAELEKALNEAALNAKDIGLRIRMDSEGILEQATECNLELKSVENLLKEVS